MEASQQPYAAARSASGLTLLAIASPLTGLAVEMVLAWRFGASATVDAFRIASLLIFFGQQIFIFHILPNAIVPIFAEHRARGEEHQAWSMAFSLANLLFLPTALACLVVFMFPNAIVHLLGPGLADEARNSAILFVRWFSLAYLPLVWSGVAAGVLYAYGIFWLPTASQLYSNIVLVVVILSFSQRLGPASLAVGILLASVGTGGIYALRLALLARRVGVRYSSDINTRVGKIVQLALPLVATLVLAQWGIIVINRVLSGLPTGTLATFGYAWKMGHMVSLLPGALGTVLFPRFALSWQSTDAEEFRDVCTRALRMALFIALPLTCVGFLLRVPLLTIVLERGELSREAAEAAARLFGVLILGAPAYVINVYLQKMLYAVQAMQVTTYATAASTLCLMVAAPTLERFGPCGVAVLLAALQWLTMAGVLGVLCWQYQAVRTKEIGLYVLGVLPLALAAGQIGSQASRAFGRLIGSQPFSQASTLAVGIALAAVTYYGLALVWRLPEACQGQRYLQWQSRAIVRGLYGAIHRIERLVA